MTQFFAGWKPGYGPVVKVLKYDADDPLTLSNAAYGRFFFNSEIQNIGYIYSIAAWDYNSGIGSGYTFYPVGSNATTATHGYDSKMSGAISQYVFFFGRRMGHGGILALVEGRKRRANATDRSNASSAPPCSNTSLNCASIHRCTGFCRLSTSTRALACKQHASVS